MADDNANAASAATEGEAPASGGAASGADAGRGGGEFNAAAPASGDKAGKEAPSTDAKRGDAKAPDAKAADDVPEWARDVPAQFRGKDERETIARLLGSQKDLRDHLARNGGPVKDISEYDFKPNDRTAPWLGESGDIELANKALSVFQKHGLGKVQAPAVLNDLMEMMIDLEVMDPPIDPAKERAQLVPEEARLFPKSEQDNLATRRIEKAHAMVKLLIADGLPEADAMPLIGALSTAGGVRLVEFLAGKMGSTNPLTGTSMASPLSDADIDRMIAETPRDDLAGQAKITEAIKRLHGAR